MDSENRGGAFRGMDALARVAEVMRRALRKLAEAGCFSRIVPGPSRLPQGGRHEL